MCHTASMCQNRLMTSAVCLTYPVKQLSSRAVFQEKVHSWTFFPMPKKPYDVVMVEHLWNKSTRTLPHCPAAKYTSALGVKLTHLVDADLLPDVLGAVLCLRSVNHFHCHRLLRVSVHQQPDPGTKDEDGKSTTMERIWTILVNRYCWTFIDWFI